MCEEDQLFQYSFRARLTRGSCGILKAAIFANRLHRRYCWHCTRFISRCVPYHFKPALSVYGAIEGFANYFPGNGERKLRAYHRAYMSVYVHSSHAMIVIAGRYLRSTRCSTHTRSSPRQLTELTAGDPTVDFAREYSASRARARRSEKSRNCNDREVVVTALLSTVWYYEVLSASIKFPRIISARV